MRLSIIIPTYNRCDLLLQTLKSLEAQTLAPSEFEVIVVVDGSTDRTVEALRDLNTAYRLKSIVQMNRGQAAARNAGAEQASSDILLFLDDDVSCTTDLLAQHLSLVQSDTKAVVFGPIFLSKTSPRTIPAEAYRRYAEARFSAIDRSGPRLPQHAMLAPNSSIHADLFRSSGGYNTELERLEDIELGYKLWKLGARFIYSREAIAYHAYDKDDENLVLGDAPRFGVSDLKLCRLHSEYRPFSTIRHFVEQRTFFARMAASLPFSVDHFLAIAYRAASMFRATSLAIRLLQMRQGIAALRSAVTFAGGWAELERELDARNPHA